MRTFELNDGTTTLTLDDAGSVTKAGAGFGTWTTNDANQIVIRKTTGGEKPIDVDWRFDANNHLCVDQAGTQVFDINGDTASMPGFRLENAVLFIMPVADAPFEFSIHPKWSLTPKHDLVMSVNGKESTIDGVINDRNSAFRFRFVDKLEVIETFVLAFKGQWKNADDPERPAAVMYEYDTEDPLKPGVFNLPNKLVVDNNSLVLAYNYDKDGRTQSIQLVGQFSFSNFELNYAIERKNAADGISTTLTFDVDVKGRSTDGKVIFVLKRKDSGATTETTLAIGAAFTARFKQGVLTIGVTYSQRTINGTMASRELMFTGKLVHKGGTEFFWELKMANGLTAISIAADHIKLGDNATGTAKVTIKMKGGEVKAVQALFGISF